MSKLYSVVAGGVLSALALGTLPAAGQLQPTPTRRVCATEEVNNRIQAELQRTVPGYNAARQTSPSKTFLAGRTGAVTYTLPVIVHVIHNGEAVGTGSNISEAQVQSQLSVLNEDYRNTNADGALVPSVYQPLRGDMQIQFVAAKYDPSGNVLAEPGIDRVNRNTKGFTAPPYGGTGSPNTTYIDDTIKPQTYWDPSRYINIWVMDLNGGGLLGYAQFPDNTAGLGGLNASGGAAATDGVVIKHSAYGSRKKYPAGTYLSTFDSGRTLTHELGHWFSLRHIWGDATCGDDYCTDTPTQQAASSGCPTFPHVSCSNVTGDMTMDYMDYSNDACLYMFTKAQKDRMQAVMAAGTPRRTELANSAVGCPGSVAATISGPTTVCAGSTATLTVAGPVGATYVWTGPNGFTSTQQNPTLPNTTFAMAGAYSVRVSVTTGPCPTFLTTTLSVNPTPATPTLTPSGTAIACDGSPVTLMAAGPVATGTLPSENFDNGTPTGWTIANAGAPATTWQYTTGNTLSYASASSTFGFNNFSLDGTRFAYALSDAGGRGSVTNTTLTSPVFSTVGYSALSLSFQQVTIVDNGYDAVEISTDGGTTWTAVYTNNGNILSPTTATINLNGYLNQPKVQVRWHYVDSYGYIWFIDNVAFTGTPANYTYAWSLVSGNGLPATTNTPTITVTPTQNSVYRLDLGFAGNSCTSSATVAVSVITNSIQAYPVPFGDEGLSLQLSTCTAGPVAVQIYDALGRRVYNSTVSNAQAGSTTLPIPETGLLQPGRYIVKVQQGTQNTTLNVIRQ